MVFIIPQVLLMTISALPRRRGSHRLLPTLEGFHNPCSGHWAYFGPCALCILGCVSLTSQEYSFMSLLIKTAVTFRDDTLQEDGNHVSCLRNPRTVPTRRKVYDGQQHTPFYNPTSFNPVILPGWCNVSTRTSELEFWESPSYVRKWSLNPRTTYGSGWS